MISSSIQAPIEYFFAFTITVNNISIMAKSLRAKTKRAFRSKKREEGVYAAAAAARLHRLNAKLLQITKMDKEGDLNVNEGKDESGWCWFATFGLLDPNEITPEKLESLATGGSELQIRNRSRSGAYDYEDSF